MKIAVLLSSYNGEMYIKQQLDSIFSQELDDIDLTVIVRDDGSSDSTLSILESYLANHNNLIVLKGKNIGFVGSFFSLIDYASQTNMFDLYSLSDQDDYWMPDKIISGIRFIEKSNALSTPCLYMSASKPVDCNLEPCGKVKRIKKLPTFYNTIVQNLSAGHTYIFNDALAKKIPYGLDYNRIYAHDSYLLNLASLTGTILYDPEPHSLYRQHNNNQMGTSNSGLFRWLKNRIGRMKKGELVLYTAQILYILESFNAFLNNEQKREIEALISCNTGFLKRFFHSFVMKPYRVGFLNNIAFKILFVSGKYKVCH